MKYSYRYGVYKKKIAYGAASLSLLFASLAGGLPLVLQHQASAVTPTVNFTDVALTQSELDNNWATDRTTPSGGYESVTFDGRTAAELRVDNNNASTDAGFYRTEGIQRQISASDAVKADLYVDGSWLAKPVRTGLWGVAKNSGGDITAYPIVEFTANNAGFTGWRAWDGVDGGWTNLSNTYNQDNWNTLEIVHNNGSGKFNIYINDQLAVTNAGADSVSLNAVILNSFNSATGNAADNYAAHWSNFGYGNLPTTPTVSACATTNEVFTSDLATWNLSETRSAGHNEIIADGLHIYTDDASSNAKAAGYYTTDFPLSGLGDQTIAESFDYQATTGITPGLQLVTDFNNDGTPDGILVGESVYGNTWWLSNGAAQFVKDNAPNTGGGYGSTWFGTANDWLRSFPEARVKAIGYSLGSGVHGDGIIHRISLGCTNYTFGFAAPVISGDNHIAMRTGEKYTLAPTVTGAAPLTYHWTVSDSKLPNRPHDPLNGSSLMIGPAPKGDYTVTLTVTDGHGLTTTKTYDVTISTPAALR